MSAGPVIESFEDRLELVASGQAVAVLPTGDRRSSLRAGLVTVPVEGFPASKVLVATRVGEQNPLVFDFVLVPRHPPHGKCPATAAMTDRQGRVRSNRYRLPAAEAVSAPIRRSPHPR